MPSNSLIICPEPRAENNPNIVQIMFCADKAKQKTFSNRVLVSFRFVSFHFILGCFRVICLVRKVSVATHRAHARDYYRMLVVRDTQGCASPAWICAGRRCSAPPPGRPWASQPAPPDHDESVRALMWVSRPLLTASGCGHFITPVVRMTLWFWVESPTDSQ